MLLRVNNLRVSLLNEASPKELASKKLGIRKQNIIKIKSPLKTPKAAK